MNALIMARLLYPQGVHLRYFVSKILYLCPNLFTGYNKGHRYSEYIRLRANGFVAGDIEFFHSSKQPQKKFPGKKEKKSVFYNLVRHTK